MQNFLIKSTSILAIRQINGVCNNEQLSIFKITELNEGLLESIKSHLWSHTMKGKLICIVQILVINGAHKALSQTQK